MRISVDSEDNIRDVREDIELFGEDFKVFAIYSLAEVDEQEFEYISSYVDAEKPTRDEFESPRLFAKDDKIVFLSDDEEIYQQLVSDYEKNIASLEFTKHELMTLAELLEKLEEQNRII